jgi:threonine/homoserine/homoserine lactone efflux protein
VITFSIWVAWLGVMVLLASTDWVARMSERRAGLVVIGSLFLALAATIAVNT